MAFDAHMYSVSHKDKIPGETLDSEYSKKAAWEVLNFELGAENNINIGSQTGGGGAGKATFKEMSITKKTDTASTQLFYHLVTGTHFDDMFLELRRSGGETVAKPFLKFEFALVMVQDISWSGADGDDVCEETILFQFGAVKMQYIAQDAQGKMSGQTKEAIWSRVKNNSSMDVSA